MTKLLTIYFDGGDFSQIFEAETMDRTPKLFKPKMMARTTSITMQNLVEIARRTLA